MSKNEGGCPVRTCVSCGTKKPKAELIRFVMHEGICRDEKQIKHGRGAYVCINDECAKTGLEKNKLQRSLQKATIRRNRKTG
jgi:predicted RNA-binding protein YlxR (DUF448 family)